MFFSKDRFARTGAHRTDLGKAGVFFDLNPPTLVFGKVPVEHIEFLQSHQIEGLQDGFHALEVTAFIQHETPPLKTRPVRDDLGRDIPFCRGDQVLFFDFNG